MNISFAPGLSAERAEAIRQEHCRRHAEAARARQAAAAGRVLGRPATEAEIQELIERDKLGGCGC